MFSTMTHLTHKEILIGIEFYDHKNCDNSLHTFNNFLFSFCLYLTFLGMMC